MKNRLIAWIKSVVLMGVLLAPLSVSAPAYAGKMEDTLLPAVHVYVGRGTAISGGGTGIAVHVDPVLGTYIVTAWHVVKDSLDTIEVSLYNDPKNIIPATIYAYDISRDLAIIRIPTKMGRIASIESSSIAATFDPVICVGNNGLRGIDPSTGIIQSPATTTPLSVFPGQSYRVIDVQCPTYQGSSGGGVFVENDDGRWVMVGVIAYVWRMRTIRTAFGPIATHDPTQNGSIASDHVIELMKKYGIYSKGDNVQ